jgi:hypothetical protein
MSALPKGDKKYNQLKKSKENNFRSETALPPLGLQVKPPPTTLRLIYPHPPGTLPLIRPGKKKR